MTSEEGEEREASHTVTISLLREAEARLRREGAIAAADQLAAIIEWLTAEKGQK